MEKSLKPDFVTVLSMVDESLRVLRIADLKLKSDSKRVASRGDLDNIRDLQYNIKPLYNYLTEVKEYIKIQLELPELLEYTTK